jgi:hypothetical protein
MADLDEAGIEAGDRFEQMLPYGRATIEVERWLDDERVAVLRDTGARQVFPASTLLNENYWRRLSLSRVGSVAVEDVRALLKDTRLDGPLDRAAAVFLRERESAGTAGGCAGRIVSAFIDGVEAEFSRSSTDRPEQPEPDVLGGQPPAEPEAKEKDERRP